MTTDTTNKEAGALKPCPMCNASLSEATASGYHHHPANGCIFSGFELSRDDVATWNRRAPAEALTDEQIINIADSYSFTWDEGIVAFARELLSTTHPVEQGLIYQIAFSDDEGGWSDTSEQVYSSHPEHMRRIVYAAPVASGGERS